MKTLQLEIREGHPLPTGQIGNRLVITPPLDEDFWLFRVKLSETQAMLGFPKFFLVGIGFAVEEDWNRNLPSNCEAEEIFAHIRPNKGDDAIADDSCVEAIRMIKEAVEALDTRESWRS